MPRNRLPRVMKNTILQLAEGIMADLCRDFWIRETGTGQRVAQLHDRYDDDDDDDDVQTKIQTPTDSKLPIFTVCC